MRHVFLLSVLSILTLCGAAAFVITPSTPPRNDGYVLGSWPDARGPYAVMTYHDGPRDASGVRVIVLNGVTYQQPVSQAQDGLYALVRYATAGDPADLTLAEQEATRLATDRVTNPHTGAAWWLPYDFDYQVYPAPGYLAKHRWWSGMAQGTALDLFTRLYGVTGDPQWQAAAQAVFASFLSPLQPGQSLSAQPWVVRTDSKNYLWIDEYPTPQPDYDVINGLGFAIYGLVDYYQQFGVSQAKLLAQQALTTFLYAATTARHKGGVSSYCLQQPTDRSASYHIIVTQQLWRFAVLTGSPHLTALEAAYWQDYHA